MHIIALQGEPISGKSTSINFLYHRLKENGFSIVKDRRIKNSNDFTAILSKEKIKLGISSYGDSVKLILGPLEKFKEQSCNVIVTACRPSGNMKAVVENFDGYTKKYIDKNPAENLNEKEDENRETAKEMLLKIEGLL